MDSKDYTRQEMFFKKSMGILCILFLVGAILFAAIPDHLLRAVNWSSTFLKMKSPLVPSRISVDKQTWETFIDPANTLAYSDAIRFVPGTKIWVSLAVAMMIMIAFIAGMNYLDPKKYMQWIPLLLISKGTTSVLGIIYFYASAKYLSNLLLTLVDFPIFVFILVIWLMVRKSADTAED